MNFYVVENPENTKGSAVTDFVDADPVRRGEAPKCPSCGRFVGLLPWLPPHRVVLEVWGKEYGDIVFGPGYELLVSERLVELYKTEGLSGFEGFCEVEIFKVVRRGGSRLRTPPPPYYCVTVARSRAAVDVEASGLVLREPYTCNECRGGLIIRTARIVIEEGTWSGEDIFRPRGLSGVVLTSERFKKFFERNRINNGILVEANRYSFDFYPGVTDFEKTKRWGPNRGVRGTPH